MTIDEIVKVTNAKQTSDGFMGHCQSHNDRTPSLSISEAPDSRPLVFCHAGCEQKKVWSDLKNLIGEKTTMKQNFKKKIEPDLKNKLLVEKIWAGSKSLDDASSYVACKYLLSRGLDPDCALDTLRFNHELVTTVDGQTVKCAALIGPINNAKNEIIGIQRIFLSSRGEKANFEMPKRILGQVNGGAISFGAPSNCVHIAEGVETSLAIYQSLKEWCLSLISANGIAGYQVSEKVTEVHIWADNDKNEVGQIAAHRLAERMFADGKKVFVHLPMRVDRTVKSVDWLDVLNNEGVEKIREIRLQAEPFDQFDVMKLPKARTLEQLRSEADPENDYLVAELLSMDGISLLTARPKVGKSTLARQLIASINSGKPFLNRDTRKGKCLYLALEEKLSEVKKHFIDLKVEDEKGIAIHCGVAPKNPLEWLQLLIENFNPQLIVIDPIFRFLRAKDGNSYSEITGLFEPLVKIAREGSCHILCVHHANKGEGTDGNETLGSTAIFAAVDASIFMKLKDKARTIYSMQRYGTEIEESVLGFDPLERSITIVGERHKLNSVRIEEEILAALDIDQVPTRESDLKEKIEAKSQYFRLALSNLINSCKVARSGTGKKGDPYLYFKAKDSTSLVPH